MLAAVAAMVVLYFASGVWFARPVTRALVGWDGGVLLFVTWSLLYMRRTSVAQMKERADTYEAGARAILLTTVFAAVASVGALIAELSQAKGESDTALHVMLAAGTVVVSWLFVQFVFAIH